MWIGKQLWEFIFPSLPTISKIQTEKIGILFPTKILIDGEEE